VACGKNFAVPGLKYQNTYAVARILFADKMKKHVAISLVVICFVSALGHAQQAPRGGQQQRAREDSLDPTPIDPAKDPNVDMFLNDWRNAKPVRCTAS